MSTCSTEILTASSRWGPKAVFTDPMSNCHLAGGDNQHARPGRRRPCPEHDSVLAGAQSPWAGPGRGSQWRQEVEQATFWSVHLVMTQKDVQPLWIPDTLETDTTWKAWWSRVFLFPLCSPQDPGGPGV